jgi:hypothetical protein
MSRTIRTPEKEAEVLAEIARTGNVAGSCRRCGVGKMTWYEWKQNDPELQKAHEQAMTDGRASKADLAEDALLARINKGDTTAIIFALKTLRRDTYGERILNEISGPDGAPLVVLLNSRPDGPA